MRTFKALVLMVVIFCIVIVSANFALLRIRSEVKQHTHHSLSTTLQTTRKALHRWIEQQKNELMLVSRNKEVAGLIKLLLLEWKKSDGIVNTQSQIQLRNMMFRELLKIDGQNFFVITPDHSVITSMQENIALQTFVQPTLATFVNRALAGETLFVPPGHTTGSKQSENREAMQEAMLVRARAALVITPVRGDMGEVIAALAISFDPYDDLSVITQEDRIGSSGTTYAFNDQGQIMTATRIATEINRTEEKASTYREALSIELFRSGDTELSTTVGAGTTVSERLRHRLKEVLDKQSGHNLDGYPNSLGNAVMGAWIWDKTLGLGLVAEVNIDEVMRPYSQARVILTMVLAVAVCFSLALLIILVHYASKTILHNANLQMEEKIRACRKEFGESEAILRTVFESSTDALILLDANGLIECNQATLSMFQCKTKEEFLTRSPVEWCAAIQLDGMRYSRGQLLALYESITRKGHHVFEWNYIRTDGEIFPTEVLYTPLHVNGQRIVQATIRDISKRKDAEEELAFLKDEIEQLCLIDPLTGIANKNMVDQVLESEWRRACRNRQPLSLVLIDIDDFQQYTDSYGYRQGDHCLKEVAKLLTLVVERVADLVARLEGDKFILLLPETSLEQAQLLAEMVTSIVAKQKIPHNSSKVSNALTVSTGVSSHIPSIHEQPSLLLDKANELLSQVKASGYDHVEGPLGWSNRCSMN